MTMAVSRALIVGVFVQLLTTSGVTASDPIDVLNQNGLSKSGRFFVLNSEEQAIQGLMNIAPFADRMAGKWNQWAAIIQNEYEFQQLGDYRVSLISTINDYNAVISQMPTRNPMERLQKQEVVAERNAWDAELRATNTQLELRRRRLVGEPGKRQAEEDFNQARGEFLGAKRKIWPQIEKTLNRYDELKTIDSVLNALKQYNADAHAQLKIGPSDSMTKKIKQVFEYERTYSPETAPAPKKVARHKRLEKKKTRKNTKQASPDSASTAETP
jgi:hypothetical protein